MLKDVEMCGQVRDFALGLASALFWPSCLLDWPDTTRLGKEKMPHLPWGWTSTCGHGSGTPGPTQPLSTVHSGAGIFLLVPYKPNEVVLIEPVRRHHSKKAGVGANLGMPSLTLSQAGLSVRNACF